GAPASAMQGDKLTVQWTVQNVGTDVARGAWTDGIYLSTDAVWSTDDILLGSAAHVGDLGVTQSYQATAAANIPAVAPGTYYILVRANSDDALFEGQNLANNTAVSAPITVDLPQLQIGTPLADSLPTSGTVKAYQLAAPAGQDVVVTLTGASGTTNELYA